MSPLTASLTGLQHTQNTSVLFNKEQSLQPHKAEHSPYLISNRQIADTLSQHKEQPSSTHSFYPSYNRLGVLASNEKLSYNSLAFDFKNKDGDTVHLQLSLTQYQQSMTAAELIGKDGQPVNNKMPSLEEIINGIKNNVMAMQKEVIKNFLKTHGIEPKETDTEYDEDKVKKLEDNMPEFWNAENTSQRIVNFATAFYGIHGEGSLDDFVNSIKDAVKAGFGEAKEELGELPGAVKGLINKTYDLVMQKIDAWRQDMTGVETEIKGAA